MELDDDARLVTGPTGHQVIQLPNSTLSIEECMGLASLVIYRAVNKITRKDYVPQGNILETIRTGDRSRFRL